MDRVDVSNPCANRYELKSLRRELIASAQRVMATSRELCRVVHDRRRGSDFRYRLAKYTKTFPHMRRFISLCGGEGELLRIETEEQAEAMVIHISGEVDLGNVTRLRAALEPALENCRNLILDMGALRYIDSTGLHALIDANKVLQENNRQLVVAGASRTIAKVMHILDLDRLIPRAPSVAQAIALIRARPSSAASEE